MGDRSGGVIYLGGGTAVQQSCGVADTQEQMELYLRQEVQDTVDEQTVRAFCQQSPENCAWLQRHGVVFGERVPGVTSEGLRIVAVPSEDQLSSR